MLKINIRFRVDKKKNIARVANSQTYIIIYLVFHLFFYKFIFDFLYYTVEGNQLNLNKYQKNYPNSNSLRPAYA